MIQLDEIAGFLDGYFGVHRFTDDQGGIYRGSNRPIQRIGVALEPWTELSTWIDQARLDALFLHRPWQLDLGQLTPDIGIAAYHLAFDERLTLGYNTRLAEVLGLNALEPLGVKEGRTIGMLGKVALRPFAQICQQVQAIFGGYESANAGTHDQIQSVAVIGAMTDGLVREAAQRGADIYLTGQLRQPAQAAVRDTGIGVIAVGHRRSEEWGLCALAGVLRERWAYLEVVLPP